MSSLSRAVTVTKKTLGPFCLVTMHHISNSVLEKTFAKLFTVASLMRYRVTYRSSGSGRWGPFFGIKTGSSDCNGLEVWIYVLKIDFRSLFHPFRYTQIFTQPSPKTFTQKSLDHRYGFGLGLLGLGFVLDGALWVRVL